MPTTELTDLNTSSPVPGTYALVLESRTESAVQVGRCGTLLVQPGFFVYVGSSDDDEDEEDERDEDGNDDEQDEDSEEENDGYSE